MTKKLTTSRVIITAMLVDIVDIVTNTFVAVISGSAVMLVEAMAGVADFFSMLLLLIGNKRSYKRPTKMHPFGHGKEQYFWATLAGFIILVITANLSFIFGWHAFKHPDEVGYIGLTYLVLFIAVLTNGYAFLQAGRKLLAGRPWRNLVKSFNWSWDVASKTALVMDAMGSVSAIIGLISLVLYGLTGNHTLDGIGAMIMAVTMGLFSILLLISVRSLIIGQSAPREFEKKIRESALTIPEVVEVVSVQSMILGNEGMLVNLHVNLKNGLDTDQIEKITQHIKAAVQQSIPDEAIAATVEITAHSK